MNDLIKIQEVSSKYDITARTLRYYEDMGLIVSARSADYAYRLYDETADGLRMLLRLSDISEFDRKSAEYCMMERAHGLGIPTSPPLGFGLCDDGK